MTSAAVAGVGTHVLRDLLGHKTTAMADRYVRHVGNPVRDAREQVGNAMGRDDEGPGRRRGEAAWLTGRTRQSSNGCGGGAGDLAAMTSPFA